MSDAVCLKRGTGKKKENKLEAQEKYEYTKKITRDKKVVFQKLLLGILQRELTLVEGGIKR